MRRIPALAVAATWVACGANPSDLDASEQAPPVAVIDGPQTVATGSVIELSGARSRDPLGQVLFFQWRVASRPNDGPVNLGTPNARTTTLLIQQPGTYEIQLVVFAGDRASTPARWIGEAGADPITGPTGSPIAVIRGDVAAAPGETIELSGSESHNPRGDPLSFAWRLVATPPNAPAEGFEPRDHILRFTPPVEGAWTIALTVSSGGDSHEARHTVIVTEPATPGTADVRVLPARVVDAEHSRALDAIVLATESPPEVRALFPDGRDDDVRISLPAAATSISVSPDGLTAAVGHDGALSHVDLEAGVVLRTYPVTCDVLDVVLGDNGWAYAFPRRDQWESVRAIELASGREVTFGGIYAGTVGRLHPSGRALYAADNGLYPSDIQHFVIDTGAVTRTWDSPYHGDYPMCGDLWFAGDRLITRCGTVLRTADDQENDLLYAGSLPARTYVSVAYAEATDRVYALDGALTNHLGGGAPADAGREVRVFSRDFLQELPGIRIPRFPGPGMSSVRSFGRWVFTNAAGTRVHVVMQADPAAGAAHDFGVWSVTP